MIAKKNPKADLEKKRFAFFQIGLILAGSTCLAAFEYSTASVEQTYVQSIPTDGGKGIIDEPMPSIPDPFKQPKKKKIVIIKEDVTVVEKKRDETETKVIDNLDERIVFDDEGDDDGEEEFGIVEPTDPIIPVPDIEPQFPGGFTALGEFINDNIELPDYIPDYDRGTVYVEFVVNKDGSIEQVGIRQGLSPELDKAAKRVVHAMPKWVPGEQAGKPVRVRFTLPIQITSN